MKELLTEIQNEMAEVTSLLDQNKTEEARSLLHYLHAYIEKRKQEISSEEPVAV